ncbi:MAG TPA: SdpI family protein [Dyella sp.]|uniref:SdpI family protein n=1 Tax=Dyella sp. TaxID=1869338 RepID=UPI002CCD2FDD|nr:SdpI family protein [Dyella sp.]HTV85771.1 SdpI family protein [Dyella sp.]
MKPVRSLFLSALFLLTLLGAFLWLSPQLPAHVAVHWNAQGQINGYATPIRAVVTPMIIMAVLGLLTVALPAISPRGFEITPFVSVFVVIMLAVQAFVLITALGILLNAAGHPIGKLVTRMLPLGVLLMIIGNYMGKLRKNFFAGIRTPWTIVNDEVWERTHRLAGWLFMLAGLVVVAVSLMGASMLFSVGAMLAAALIPAVYSYFVYRRVERNH